MPEPAQILTVAQLTRKVRMLLEIQIGEIWVEGEISNLRRQASGHVYFTLKDATAQLSCVMFRTAAARSAVEWKDGILVQAFGELSVYEAQGKYQLVVGRIQEKGAGVLQARFEALKRRLQEEGLFSPERKKPLPVFPRVVGLVTSPTGAAVRDMLQILGRRAPWVEVLVAPVRVQGKGAELEIAGAIQRLNDEAGVLLPPIDLLIVGRGGGSVEDLWCFNEEVVARAIAGSRLPVISAVGHEIDFTIADFAADVRAPTPSGAAELAVPDQAELRRRLASLRGKLDGMVARKLEFLGRLLAGRTREALRRAPDFALREASHRMDTASARLADRMEECLDEADRRLSRARIVLAGAQPQRVVDRSARLLPVLAGRMANAICRHQERASARLGAARGLLLSLGPDAVLRRGYSITLDANGRLLRSASRTTSGDVLTTRLADGEVTSVVR